MANITSQSNNMVLLNVINDFHFTSEQSEAEQGYVSCPRSHRAGSMQDLS